MRRGVRQLRSFGAAVVFVWCALLAGCTATRGLAEAGPASETSTPTIAVTPSPVPPTPTQTPTAIDPPSRTPPPTPIATAVPRAVSVPVPATAVARVVDRVVGERRSVALTFDAGADTGFATQILDTLREQQVVASFGMTGSWAERNPALLRRMVTEGHQLMNHTYDHTSFTGVSTRADAMSAPLRHQQIGRTEEIVRLIAGAELRPYFRPPYGDYDTSVNVDIAAAGYRYNVMWAVDSLGWNGLPAGAIVQRCLQRATPGAIFVFHVGAASQDAAALAGIIEGLRRDGYEFATVRQLVEA